MTPTPNEWFELTRRNARSVQTTVGWIFWDPEAVARYEELGLPGPLGYIAARVAPFGGASYEAKVAALGSISPLGVRFVHDLLDTAGYQRYWEARNEAVLLGLRRHAPDVVPALEEFAPLLWRVIEQLPFAGRPFAASHLDVPRYEDPVLSGWHAVNVLREWRGDTHWALVATHNLNGPEASALHNAWLRYDGDWLSNSRGIAPEDVAAAWRSLEAKGLARDGVVNEAGLALREELENATDRATTLPWELLGWDDAVRFHERFEPPCVQLLKRVDVTAGENYQPASRVRPSN